MVKTAIPALDSNGMHMHKAHARTRWIEILSFEDQARLQQYKHSIANRQQIFRSRCCFRCIFSRVPAQNAFPDPSEPWICHLEQSYGACIAMMFYLLSPVTAGVATSIRTEILRIIKACSVYSMCVCTCILPEWTREWQKAGGLWSLLELCSPLQAHHHHRPPPPAVSTTHTRVKTESTHSVDIHIIVCNMAV